MKHSIKNYLILFWKGWGYSLFVAVIISFTFKSAIAELYVVPTGSMKPTIVEGDRIFVNKLAYDLKFPFSTWHMAQWGDPQRGEIVVCYSPKDGTRLIKRVVGMPGDTVSMQNNQLVINGERMAYESIDPTKNPELWNYADDHQYLFDEDLSGKRHSVMISPQMPSPRSFDPVVVPKGKYLMMGDNRDNSADSRYFGFVDRSQILGQAKYVFMSLDVNNHCSPRWKRFFKKLP